MKQKRTITQKLNKTANHQKVKKRATRKLKPKSNKIKS